VLLVVVVVAGVAGAAGEERRAVSQCARKEKEEVRSEQSKRGKERQTDSEGGTGRWSVPIVNKQRGGASAGLPVCPKIL